MADSYTPRTNLILPANGDRGWDVLVNDNTSEIDGFEAIGSLAVGTTEVPSATLNIKVAAGIFEASTGASVFYAGASSVAMTASATNYVYLTDSGTLTVNTTGFPASTFIVPLAIVVAGASTITSVTDARMPWTSFGATSIVYTTQSAAHVLAGPTTGSAALPTFRALVGADLPVFGASGSSHSVGAVPDPGSTAGSTRYLREDGTWDAPGGTGTVTSVALDGDGTVLNASVTGSPVTGSGTLTLTLVSQSANAVLAGPTTGSAAAPTFRALVGADLPVFGASGPSHAPGAVPDPGSTAGSSRYLREDGTWDTPSGAGTVTDVSVTAPSWLSVSVATPTSTPAITITGANQVANTILAGPTSGTPATPGFRILVAADLPVFGASGASHSAGAVPDPGSTAGSTRYLREDGTWDAPPGSTSGTVTSVALDGDGTVLNASVTGSPVTSSGTLTLSLKTQSANTVLAGPTSGSAADPTFRDLVVADMPVAAPYTATYASSITFNMANGPNQEVTLTGNPSLAITGDVAGTRFELTLKQDSTGSRTVSGTWWTSTIRWGPAGVPTLTTTPNKEDTFLIENRGSGDYRGYVTGQGY